MQIGNERQVKLMESGLVSWTLLAALASFSVLAFRRPEGIIKLTLARVNEEALVRRMLTRRVMSSTLSLSLSPSLISAGCVASRDGALSLLFIYTLQLSLHSFMIAEKWTQVQCFLSLEATEVTKSSLEWNSKKVLSN